MPLRTRIRKLIVWGTVFVLAVLAGAVAFAYTYITDSDTLAALINAQLPTYLPGSRLEVERVQLRPLVGYVDIKQATLLQPLDGRPYPTARAPWLQIRCDAQKLWRGQFEPQEIIVAQPTLRLTRREDGSWNLQGLLADPWPQTPLMKPVLRVTKGTVALADDGDAATLLHDVELTFEPTQDDGIFSFGGSAQGDAFERLVVEGTLDSRDGRLCLTRADLAGLTVSETLRDRLPPEWLPAWDEVGLTAGALDVELEYLRCDPTGLQRASYAMNLGLRGGAWACKRLPFPLSEVTASARIENGKLTVSRVVGHYGKTVVRVNSASLDAADPADGPMELDLEVANLELNANLRDRLPAEMRTVWNDFAPYGRSDLGWVSLGLRATRQRAGQPIGFAMGVQLLDVAMTYRLFPFPLEHVRGELTWEGTRVTLKHLETTSVGGRKMTAKGTIDNPGPDAVVNMDFTALALPIDEGGAFVQALPPDIRSIVLPFHPTGTVRGSAHLTRRPGPDPTDEMGDVQVVADVDLNEESGCSVRWDGLPYLIQNMAGHLSIHPDHCEFTEIRGQNGLAQVVASGRAEVIGPGKFAADVKLGAEHLQFDKQLRDALPPEWQATWGLLNPTGYSQVRAHVVSGYADPARPDRTRLWLTIGPRDEARVRLRLTPAPGTPGIPPGGVIVLPPMQDIRGAFEFDNGLVTMKDVAFSFREAPTHFSKGQVRVERSGRFDLRVNDLGFSKLRLDAELRQIMPPLMAEFAAKLDDRRPFAAQGDLAISWSGRAGEPAVCTWEHAKVFFNDNAMAAGIPLEHIQGQFVNVHGRSDGRSLFLAGAVELDSFVVAGQQISAFSSPLEVGDGRATLSNIRASLLGGQVFGSVSATLDSTPDYRAQFRLIEADLGRFAQTLPGRQEFSGKVSGQVDLTGSGGDLRRVNGSGEAHLVRGDIGKLPFILRLINPRVLPQGSQAAFDAADLSFTISDGHAVLRPIKITGNTISLFGEGTVDPHGEIDMRFKTLYGRDERFHIPVVSDATREASGQFMVIRVRGPVTAPQFNPEFLPGPRHQFGEMVRGLGDRRDTPRAPASRIKR